MKQQTAPFRDPDGIVHATYQIAPGANHLTNCGFQCVLYLFSTDGSAVGRYQGPDEVAGRYQGPDEVVTCLVCLGGGEHKCEKCEGQGMPLHVCPFDEEINCSHTPSCHCCDECAQGCADDI